MRNRLISTALGGLFLVSLAVPAFAHAHLQSATPAANGSVATAPSQITLTFSEGVNLKFSGVKVTGPQKSAVKAGKASLTGGDATLSVPIAGKLGAGTYTVDWHILSVDGHKTNGSYTFTVNP